MVFLIYAAGTYARISGVGWDASTSLHADERHSAFVVTGATTRFENAGSRLTDVFRYWFDTGSSVLNPRNSVPFYVYGDLPQALVTLQGIVFDRRGWDRLIELGRLNAVAFDSLTILLVAFGAYLLGGWPSAAWASLLYAALPLSIQNSNFFTVDASLTFFSAVYFVGLMLFSRYGRWRDACLTGGALGLAMAGKLSAVLLLPALVVVVALFWWRTGSKVRPPIIPAAAILAIAALTFRIANPSAFSGPGPFSINLDERFIKDFVQLSRFSASNSVPFLLQWQVPFARFLALRDLVLFAFGPALSISLVVAIWTAFAKAQPRHIRDDIVLLLVGSAFIAALPLLSGEALLRYFLPAAPLLAMIGGFGLAVTRARVLAFALGVVALGWGFAITESHRTEHPRISASKWIWRHVPIGSTIANETGWDEALPIGLKLSADEPARDPGREYKSVSLDVTIPDSPRKIENMIEMISRSDLVVLSSDRQYGPMLRLPNRFPMTDAYYQHLFDGSLCLEIAAQFIKPFIIFGIPVDDRWTQESWRVFDRPPVILFKKAACFNKQKLYDILLAGNRQPKLNEAPE
jgi:hypothetical protein